MLSLSTISVCALTALSASIVNAAPTSLPHCGHIPYNPKLYTCPSNNPVLCPIVNGQPFLSCGNACYDSHMYTCGNGTLSTLPAYNGVFSLTASNPIAPFDGQKIQASGYNFYIGRATATYCPEIAAEQGDCPAGNETYLLPSAMSAIVPGGQRPYIQENGAFSYSEAHDDEDPNQYTEDFLVYDGANGGGYFTSGSVSWLACPVSNSTGVWQVYASLSNVTFPAGCTGFDALVHDAPADTEGAWQYV